MSNIRDLINNPANFNPHNETVEAVSSTMVALMESIRNTSIVTQPHSLYLDGKPQQAVAYRSRTITTDQVVSANDSFVDALGKAQYNGMSFVPNTYTSDAERNSGYDMVCNIAQRILYCVSSTNPTEYLAGDTLPIIRGTWAVYNRARELLMDMYPSEWLKRTQHPLYHLYKNKGNSAKHELVTMVQANDEFIRGIPKGGVRKDTATGIGTRKWWRDYITAMDKFYSGGNKGSHAIIHSALRVWAKSDEVDLYLGGVRVHHYTGHPSGCYGSDIDKALEVRQMPIVLKDWVAPCDMCLNMTVTEPLTGQSVTARARVGTNNELLYTIYQMRDQLFWLAQNIQAVSAPATPRLQVTMSVSMHSKVV